MIKFRQKGDFSKLSKFFEKMQTRSYLDMLDRYGQEGVAALASATPVDTGKTADSWSYEIVASNEKVTISFNNSNVQNGVPIAIVIEYGHATRNGGWVEGRDYINPAIQPIFDRLAEESWKEVTR